MIETGRYPTPLLILDACVLIDYIKSEPALFGIIAGNVGPVHVVSTVHHERQKPEKGVFRARSTHHMGTGGLLELVRSGGLDHNSVIDIARHIHGNNPRHISAKVLADFEKKLPPR